MVISKGVEWGEPAPGQDAPWWNSARALAAAALEGHRHGTPIVARVGADDHDLLTQLGLESPRPAKDRYRYPFDLGVAVSDDGAEHPFLAHVLAHRRFWVGGFAVAMNVGWSGDWYLGPKAHPNDGLVDITVGRLGLRQRLAARRRVRTGSHLPHPDLKAVRTSEWSHRFERSVGLVVDGHKTAVTRGLSIRVVPDCLTLVV